MRALAGNGPALANARTAVGQWRRRAAVAARQLRLKRSAAMLDTIGEARIDFFAAEMEIRLARMTYWPATNAVI
jgi:putative hemolysin